MTAGKPWWAHRTGRVFVRHRLSTCVGGRPGKTRSRACLILPLLLLALILLPSPSHAEDPEIPVLTGTDASTAMVVRVDPRCAEPPIRLPEVKVSWDIDASQSSKSSRVFDLIEATEFRVDVSMYRGGFEDGRFESHHPPAAEKRSGEVQDQHSARGSSLVVPNLRPGVYYSARVLAATPDGWVASATTRFLTPICPVDGLD